jgi:hypothetical protein
LDAPRTFAIPAIVDRGSLAELMGRSFYEVISALLPAAPMFRSAKRLFLIMSDGEALVLSVIQCRQAMARRGQEDP